MHRNSILTDRQTILVMANFKAACSGNFINSLLSLAEFGKDFYKFIFMFPLRDDGSECSWTDYIRKHGYEVILYDEHESIEKIKELLFKVIRDNRIKLIHNHFSCLNDICLWDKKLHSMVKILYHDHMDYVAEKPVKPQLKKQIRLAKRYREYGIGVISVMKRKHRVYFLTPKRWYIPNGITFKRNIDRSLSREECRKVLNIKDDEKLCLFLGWDIYRKGLDIAIKAVQLARKQGHNIILGLAGFAENISDEQIERIKSIIGFNPRQDGVRFLDAWEDMFALHRAADVFLSASRTEAFAYAILEAISQNVPVVASNISGTRWCLKYSKSFKFPSENIKKCANALIKAVEIRDNPSNKDNILSKYNIDIWCERVLNVYKTMLK